MSKHKDNKSKSAKHSAPKKSNDKAVAAPLPPTASKQHEAPTTSGLPMFYNKVEILNFSRHGELRYNDQENFQFVSSANYVPLTAMEFGDAAAHYPIVFAGSETSLEPMVITGRNQGENQQIDQDGKWKAAAYVPAYVRRYPFIIINDAERNTISLGADVTSAKFNTTGTGVAIYENGKPSEAARRALQFCLNYQQAALATASICASIEGSGLLIERTAEFVLPTGKYRVNGFKIVDEAALIALSDDKFIALRKVGALPVIYMHLQSMKAWRNLLD